MSEGRMERGRWGGEGGRKEKMVDLSYKFHHRQQYLMSHREVCVTIHDSMMSMSYSSIHSRQHSEWGQKKRAKDVYWESLVWSCWVKGEP